MILIINKSKKDARALSETFYYMGILSRGVTPTEAFSEISILYKAVIIVNPEMLADKTDFVYRLRSYSSAPIYAITDTYTSSDKLLFDGILKNQYYSAKIYDYIKEQFEFCNMYPPGIYRLAGIDASANLNIPMYFDKALPFTKTETMILRTLIKAYPIPKKAKDILRYSFRESRIPDISNIRTHISVMNKKFKNATDRKLIIFSYDKGYNILTPEILETLV